MYSNVNNRAKKCLFLADIRKTWLVHVDVGLSCATTLKVIVALKLKLKLKVLFRIFVSSDFFHEKSFWFVAFL